MTYLEEIMGIRVIYENESVLSLPNYIWERYRVKKVRLDGRAAVFVYPLTEPESVNSLYKHLDRISNAIGCPVVYIPERLTYRQKMYLLRDRVPFIVDGRQIYLPFMAVYLQERNDGDRPEITTMLPSAQLLLLYYIYHGCGELLTSKATQALGFTATSISRASRQLAEMGLIQTEKRGVQKVLYSDKNPEELFAESKKYLSNPVKRKIYVPKASVNEQLVLSGYSALSEYTMLNPPAVECFAAESIIKWESLSSKRLQNVEDQCLIELWRYDPRKLTKGKTVDILSLALALKDDRDERTEEAVEGMLAQAWRDIDGKRN